MVSKQTVEYTCIRLMNWESVNCTGQDTNLLLGNVNPRQLGFKVTSASESEAGSAAAFHCTNVSAFNHEMAKL